MGRGIATASSGCQKRNGIRLRSAPACGCPWKARRPRSAAAIWADAVAPARPLLILRAASRTMLHPEMSETLSPVPSALIAARPRAPLAGAVAVPGDKSISHRALMFGALAVGRTEISGLLEGEDVLATAAALRAMGAGIERAGNGPRTDAGWSTGSGSAVSASRTTCSISAIRAPRPVCCSAFSRRIG